MVKTSETSYEDGKISITLTEYREEDTSIYVADIVLSSPEYLKTAFAQNSYGKNVTEKTSEIAEGVNAILAINGDYYGAQEKGYVLRNGTLYRSEAEEGQEDLVIYEDGSFEIISEETITAEELLEQGAQELLSFGPALIENGTIAVTEEDEVGKAMASNPRTAIGIIDNLHYVFVVSDGRTEESEGLSLLELAEFMDGLGVKTAYNLDGGGSSTMYFNGEVINSPTTNGRSIKERSVSDIVYIRNKIPRPMARRFHHFGISALTVGCIFCGVLEIYGTTNRLVIVYFTVGGMFLFLGNLMYLLQKK